MNNQSPPRVQVHQTATHSVGGSLGAASSSNHANRRPGEVKDSNGRTIVVKQLDPLKVYRLAKIMGEAADSAFARNYAAMAASVVEIDGEVESFPNSDREIETMLQRLGEDGLEAVGKALEQLSADKPKSNKDAAKN